MSPWSGSFPAHHPESLATLLGQRFPHVEAHPMEVFAAHARDHRRVPVRA
ncbi:hypothetical protein [Streptomyces sp. DH12]|nr:hypothetical protein [Streptomyces sp. DH12]